MSGPAYRAQGALSKRLPAVLVLFGVNVTAFAFDQRHAAGTALPAKHVLSGDDHLSRAACAGMQTEPG